MASRVNRGDDIQLFAVEYSQETADYVKHILQRDGIQCQAKALDLSKNKEVHFSFEKGTFDGATCFFHLENVPSRLQILKETWEVLRDDGIMFIAFYNRWGALDMFRRFMAFNKPKDFNKRWHWLLGPWAAPTTRLLAEEMKHVGFQPVAYYCFYDLSSILRIIVARLSSLIGFTSLSKKEQYSGPVKKKGFLPSIVLVEAQKKRS